MNRKAFIRNSAIIASMYPLLNAMEACHVKKQGSSKKVFILIQLLGGNDGLQTLVPLTDYRKITEARPNIFLPEKKILSLKGTSETGLHPALGGIKDMYDNGLAGFNHLLDQIATRLQIITLALTAGKANGLADAGGAVLAVEDRDRAALHSQAVRHFQEYRTDDLAQLEAAFECVGNIEEQAQLVHHPASDIPARQGILLAHINARTTRQAFIEQFLHRKTAASNVPNKHYPLCCYAIFYLRLN